MITFYVYLHGEIVYVGYSSTECYEYCRANGLSIVRKETMGDNRNYYTEEV